MGAADMLWLSMDTSAFPVKFYHLLLGHHFVRLDVPKGVSLLGRSVVIGNNLFGF